MDQIILGGVAVLVLAAVISLRRRRIRARYTASMRRPRWEAQTNHEMGTRLGQESRFRPSDVGMALLKHELYLSFEGALDVDLHAWSEILPESYQLIAMNLFCDAFVLDTTGAVHMLEPSAAGCTKIAVSFEEFCRQLATDANGRLLCPLVDACRLAGKVLSTNQCYAFTTLPLFGGKYTQDNVWVSSRSEWLDFTAEVYRKTRDLPDGAAIKLQIRE